MILFPQSVKFRNSRLFIFWKIEKKICRCFPVWYLITHPAGVNLYNMYISRQKKRLRLQIADIFRIFHPVIAPRECRFRCGLFLARTLPRILRQWNPVRASHGRTSASSPELIGCRPGTFHRPKTMFGHRHAFLSMQPKIKQEFSGVEPVCLGLTRSVLCVNVSEWVCADRS